MLYQQIQEALTFIRTKTDFQAKFAIILGTGLGSLTEDIDIVAQIAYEDIPHFPTATVQSHQGNLIFGYLDTIPVVAMAGRFHYYEGYSAKEITFPVRVLKALGIELLVISNASGSVNQHILAGDIVFVKDHIFLQSENPLRGENDERLGPRFPDLVHTYNKKLNTQATTIAIENGIRTHEGIYVCVEGPNLETPAESVYLNRIGADVVGMSTIPEVLVAKHSDLPVFVISVVTNQNYPPATTETSLEDVIELANQTAPKMRLIVKELLKKLF